MINSRILAATKALDLETKGLIALQHSLKTTMSVQFIAAIETILHSKGRVIVTGMGKSGHVGRKIAATLASTGTPAYFVHPSEASHGDLGMITGDDVILALSWSGETKELGDILDYSRRFRVQMIAITSNDNSALAQASDFPLILPKVEEACPNGLAPTTSTLMQLAMGDAIAVTLLEERGFSPQEFKKFHPGGKLGSSLKYVRDIMHKDEAIPLAKQGTFMSEGIITMTRKGFGCLGVVNDAGALIGIVTDGDLRRNMSMSLLSHKVESIMTVSPLTANPNQLVSETLEKLNSRRITALFVVDEQKPVGILHFHDLLRVGVA